MPASRPLLICASLFLVAGTAACHRAASKGAESEPPIPVVVEAVQIGAIRAVVNATAVVEALPGADFAAAQRVADAAGQHTTLRAPFSGVVAERLHNPGDLVGTSTADVIIRVIDPRQVDVLASVPVKDAGRFADGASARGVTTTRP